MAKSLADGRKDGKKYGNDYDTKNSFFKIERQMRRD